MGILYLKVVTRLIDMCENLLHKIFLQVTEPKTIENAGQIDEDDEEDDDEEPLDMDAFMQSGMLENEDKVCYLSFI